MTLPLNPPHSSLSSHVRINSLDGLRGLAIVLVLFFHTYSRWPDFIPWVTVHKDFFLFKFGHLGVQLFFLISGFVIYMTLEKCRSFNEFMHRRWLRLFPAMLIGTVLVYLSSFYFIERPNGQTTLLNTLPGLLFVDHQIMNAVQNITDFIPVEGAFWSLFVEVKFYLIFGALYFYNKTTALRNLIAIFLCAFAYVVAGKLTPALSLTLLDKVLFNMLSLQYFGWFCVGALLYRSHVENSMRFVFFSLLMMVPTVFVKYGKDLNILIACTLVYLTFYLALNNRRVSAIFANRLLVFMGFVSYPLYLIHENAMVAMTIKTYHFAPQLPELLTPWPGIILIVLVSYLIAKHIEPATRDILRKRLNVLNQAIKKEAEKRGFIRRAA
jgi:peptidoglycan/LPS O-acetylase OafA/YrhL